LQRDIDKLMYEQICNGHEHTWKNSFSPLSMKCTRPLHQRIGVYEIF
jgi:hypothetical protein